MASDTSRGGWNAQHLQHGTAEAGKPPSSCTRGERSRLLMEAMRALEESAMVRQAARNSSIVLADTHLNRAYVNDGNGGLRELSKDDGIEPVLDYGDSRIDSVKRKWHPNAFETTTIVAWVPKSLLKEIPDYYPVYKPIDPDGPKDQPRVEIGRRSRWVMPDDPAGKAEVDRWFRETHGHLITDVLTGGHDSIHGVVWNFDESAVHVHWMCDTLAPLHKNMCVSDDGAMLDLGGKPIVKYKKPLTLDKIVELTDDGAVAHAPEIAAARIGAIDDRGRLVDRDGQLLRRDTGEAVMASAELRVEAQQMWGEHNEVTETRVVDGVEKDVKITGSTKTSRYQEIYRQRLVDAGFDIALEVNPEGTSLDKRPFVHLKESQLALTSQEAQLEQNRARVAAEMRELERQADELMVNARTEADEIVSAAEAQAGTVTGDAQTEAAKIKADADAAARRTTAEAKRVAHEVIEGAKGDRDDIRQEAKADREAAAQERQSAAADREKAANTKVEMRKRLDAMPEWDPDAARDGMNRFIYQAMRKDTETFASDGQTAYEHYADQGQAAYEGAKARGLKIPRLQTEGQRREAVAQREANAQGQIDSANQRAAAQDNDQTYGQD